MNTGVMNGYFLAATDPFTSSLFNDLVSKSGAKDLTPAQVGVMGLAIDNAVKDKVAKGMSLEEAQKATQKEFDIENAAKDDQARIDAERQAQIIDEARLAEQSRQEDVARAEAAARAKAEAAAKAQQQAAAKAQQQAAAKAQQAKQAAQYTAAQNQARDVANNPSSWSAEQRQQAESSGMVNIGGVTVSNDATIRAQNEALFGPGTGDGTYSGGVSGHDYSGGGASSDVDTSYGYGGYFAKGGFVRPRKKSKKK
jgi:membrane protein involved in colicin uptake